MLSRLLEQLSPLASDWALIGGVLGGALNALCGNDLRLLPTWSKAAEPAWRLIRLGLAVSVGIGVITAVGLFWGLERLAHVGPGLHQGSLERFGLSVFVGFMMARGLTNELDKALLRVAVRSAAAAPAAHPHVTQALDDAPPYAMYELAARLAPRRRRLSPGGVAVPGPFERVHPQRL